MLEKRREKEEYIAIVLYSACLATTGYSPSLIFPLTRYSVKSPLVCAACQMRSTWLGQLEAGGGAVKGLLYLDHQKIMLKVEGV